jgi:hypothetical protein
MSTKTKQAKPPKQNAVPRPGDLVSWRDLATNQKRFGTVLHLGGSLRPKDAMVIDQDGETGSLALSDATVELKAADLIEAGRQEAFRRKVNAE